jgi:hypothetical protein
MPPEQLEGGEVDSRADCFAVRLLRKLGLG